MLKTLPLFTLSSSHPMRLAEDYMEAANAVDEAMRRVAQIDFHSRDYQWNDPSVYARAREEHEDRIARLMAVKAELDAMATYCADTHTKNEELKNRRASDNALNEGWVARNS